MRLGELLLDDVPLAVLDVETTGLVPALGHRVIELAILRLEGWQEVGRFEQLINPGRSIPAAASRINRLYDSDVAHAPKFATFAQEIAEILDGTLVVAHNAAFDAKFMAAEWILTGRPPLGNPCACTLLLAQRRYNFWRNNLRAVAHALEVPAGRGHRAMQDVWVTAQVLRRMLKDLYQWGIHTVGDVVHAQGGAIYLEPEELFALPGRLSKAVRKRTPIGIRYVDEDDNITERVIEPCFVANHQGAPYLVAFCRLRNAQRTFRVDRIIGDFPAYP